MTTEKNTAIVRRLFEEVMKGNLAIADQFITADGDLQNIRACG